MCPRLTITRTFDAVPAHVFHAWIDPALARPWLFTSPDTDVASRRIELDPRKGGKWFVTNPIPTMVIEGLGEYLEVDPPRKLVFTFAIPMFGPHVDRIVVELRPEGRGTQMSVSHELLPLEHHEAIRLGWASMFDRLQTVLEQSRWP